MVHFSCDGQLPSKPFAHVDGNYVCPASTLCEIDIYTVYGISFVMYVFVVGLLHNPSLILTLIQDGFKVATALQAPSVIVGRHAVVCHEMLCSSLSPQSHRWDLDSCNCEL